MTAAAPADPPRYRHALRLPDADPRLDALAAASTPWEPWADEPRYGEPIVASAAAALAANGADLLIVDWPPKHTTSRAFAWAALEAARRRGDLHVALCGWPESVAAPPGGDAASLPEVCLLDARRVDDAWPALWRMAGGVGPAAPAPAGPQVSVIVRSMDRATLDTALDSIAWQTYRPLDVVIVNALGDAHRQLAGVHADVPLHVVGSHDGTGLARAHAANVGLDAATGELLLFLDDDDLLLPDHVAKLVAALAAAPEAPAAYGDVDFGRMGPDGWNSEHRFAADFDPVRLYFENYLPIHAVLFRRRCVEHGARIDERLPLLEDWDFWLQCAAEGPFVRVPGVSARYFANSPGGSEVFDEGALARQSRATLFAKWHRRLSPERFIDVMFRLQTHYRAEAHALAQWRMAQDEVGALRAILAARDEQLRTAPDHAESLTTVLSERDKQLQAAWKHAKSLAAVLSERDKQLQTAREYTDSLTTVLAERDKQLHAAREYTDSLATVLAERDKQLQTAREYADSLATVLAERDKQLQAAREYADSLASVLAERDKQLQAARADTEGLTARLAARDAEAVSLHVELDQLRSEPPLSALKRTLRRQFHGR